MTAHFLSVEQATRRFAGLVAVDAVSFAMNRGEILSLIGPNGAGKTTLFNLITGQLKPSDGAIVFRDEHINNVPPQGRAQRGMGRTFQIAKPLIGLTTRENVMVGAFMRHRAHADAYDHASAVLAEVGLEARAEVPAAELTLSERRRLEVARALALEPELILLDEVMAGLNATEVGAGDRPDPSSQRARHDVPRHRAQSQGRARVLAPRDRAASRRQDRGGKCRRRAERPAGGHGLSRQEARGGARMSALLDVQGVARDTATCRC